MRTSPPLRHLGSHFLLLLSLLYVLQRLSGAASSDRAFVLSSQRKCRLLFKRTTVILHSTQNTVYLRLARWMRRFRNIGERSSSSATLSNSHCCLQACELELRTQDEHPSKNASKGPGTWGRRIGDGWDGVRWVATQCSRVPRFTANPSRPLDASLSCRSYCSTCHYAGPTHTALTHAVGELGRREKPLLVLPSKEGAKAEDRTGSFQPAVTR